MTMATKKLDMRLPADMRDELDRVAEELQSETGKTVVAADVARAAIAEWLKRGQKELPDKPLVNRGGDRIVRRQEPEPAG